MHHKSWSGLETTRDEGCGFHHLNNLISEKTVAQERLLE